MKRTIEIEDSLQDRCESAIEDIRNELISYLDQNPDTEELPCLYNDLDYSGAIHEIIDGSVPIYTSEIEATWFLHKNALEEAYENVGCGDNPLENDGMAAIYFYISDAVNEWYSGNAEEIFEEWRAKNRPVCVALREKLNGEFDGLFVSDTSEVPKGYSGAVLHVNDHGNATLYSCEDGELEEVDSIV